MGLQSVGSWNYFSCTKNSFYRFEHKISYDKKQEKKKKDTKRIKISFFFLFLRFILPPQKVPRGPASSEVEVPRAPSGSEVAVSQGSNVGLAQASSKGELPKPSTPEELPKPCSEGDLTEGEILPSKVKIFNLRL